MLTRDDKLYIAAAEDPATLKADGRMLTMESRMANRHGLITGATGTGKTVSLQNLAESFSALGVPVFITDVKGDLAALAKPGRPSGSIAARIEELGLHSQGYENRSYPVRFWDVFGEKGHPFRATVSDMGPTLFARLLELNDVQSGILNIVFHIADDHGLLLLDLEDLRAMLGWVAEHRTDYTAKYGNIAPASIGAIQRSLLKLIDDGADHFFGEPALQIKHLCMVDDKEINGDGRGFINILAADKLMNKPGLYAAVLLWLLAEIYENFPEIGDCDKPRLVLMFDEAHLMFKDMPSALLGKIEQVVRLIRSKGVGVYFVTQNPADIPDGVLSQLGNRIQHALRAFTPRDQKAVSVAAQTFRPNPAMDTKEVISSLRTGEALISFLDRKGAPTMVERGLILPPEADLGTLDFSERVEILRRSSMSVYNKAINRESAQEMIDAENARRRNMEQQAAWEQERERQERAYRKAQMEESRIRRAEEREQRLRQKEEMGIFGEILESAAKSTKNRIGREVGNALVRGLMGTFFGKK